VMVVAESVNAMRARQIRLRRAGCRIAQVVPAKLAGFARLQMSAKIRPCAPHIGPFGEVLTPPCVVLGNRVELGQVKRDGPYVAAHGCSRAANTRIGSADAEATAVLGVASATARRPWPEASRIRSKSRHGASRVATSIVDRGDAVSGQSPMTASRPTITTVAPGSW